MVRPWSSFSTSAGNFSGSGSRTSSDLAKGPWTMRQRLAMVLYHRFAEVTIGMITIVNFVLIVLDADNQASGIDSPDWIIISCWVCFLTYCVELAVRFYVERWHIFETSWNWLDIVIVGFGITEEVLRFSGVTIVSISFLRVFRCLRLIRVFKALVFMDMFKEFALLIRGCVACMRTLAWSFLLTFVFMTAWSVLAVELVHPLMRDLEDMEDWIGCERCSRSFSSVMHSNLTFFQTIVAGDSWGKVAIPMIELHPWTAAIFVGSLFTLVFGMLNLIVAVLVDSAADARARDTESRARDADEQMRKEKRTLEKIFKKIDTDESGDLTYDELKEGAQEVPEFRDRLKVMAIDDGDLHQMFVMCDEDESGGIDLQEFIETLYRLKCSDHKVASTFVKHYVLHMNKNHQHLAEKVDFLTELLRERLPNKDTRARHAVSEDIRNDNRGSHTSTNLQNFCGEWHEYSMDIDARGPSIIKKVSLNGAASLDRASPDVDSTAVLLRSSTFGSSGDGSEGAETLEQPSATAEEIGNGEKAVDYPAASPREAEGIAQMLIVTPLPSDRLRVTTPRSPRSPLELPRQILTPRVELHDSHLTAMEQSLRDDPVHAQLRGGI